MMTRVDTGPLAGVGVLVTRPAHQAEELCTLIEQQGGTAIRFPVLEIADPVDPEPLEEAVRRLDEFDYAVFVSANAVSRALDRILAMRDWPATLVIAVIGKRSAEELQQFGLRADVYPQRKFNSEALLDLEEMHQVRGKRFVIFRGNGGREFLADTLRERGAEVEYVQAYRRLQPSCDTSVLLQRWRAGQIDIVLVNSAESLQNLVEILGERGKGLLTATQLLVASERILPLAEKLGFDRDPVVADNATDEAVLNALLSWKKHHGQIASADNN
jgi:uroporphyrinogen-III synthase